MFLFSAKFLVFLIALLHIWIMLVEMLWWDKTIGLKMFANSAEKARQTKVMAQNQGIYNGFLAAGLLWALCHSAWFAALATFFLACVAVAGIVGGITVSRKIILVQTMPALLALLFIALS